jgi:hypothetical protein
MHRALVKEHLAFGRSSRFRPAMKRAAGEPASAPTAARARIRKRVRAVTAPRSERRGVLKLEMAYHSRGKGDGRAALRRTQRGCVPRTRAHHGRQAPLK